MRPARTANGDITPVETSDVTTPAPADPAPVADGASSAPVPATVADMATVAPGVTEAPEGGFARRSLADMTRRRFMRNSTVAVAAAGLAGAAGALPGLPGFLSSAESEAPAASEAAPGVAADTSGLLAPLTAHISDISTGELSLFVEDRTIVVRDPALVTRLLQAAR
jgi:hypothetical protein